MDMLVPGGGVCWPSDEDFRDFKKDATRQERADRDRNVPVLLATVGQQLKQAQADRQELSTLKSSMTQQQEQYQQQQQQYQQLLSQHEQVQESATVLTARLAAAQAAGAADALLLKQMIPALVLEYAAVLSAEPTLSGELLLKQQQQQQQQQHQQIPFELAVGGQQAAGEGVTLDNAARAASSSNGSVKLPMVRTPGQSEKGTGASVAAAAAAASSTGADSQVLPLLPPTAAAATVVKGGHRTTQSWGTCTAAVASILSGLAADEPESPTGAAAAAAQPLAAAVAAAASSPVTPAAAAAAATEIASATEALRGVLLTMPAATSSNGSDSPFYTCSRNNGNNSLASHMQGGVDAADSAADAAVSSILAGGTAAKAPGCICCSRCGSTRQAVGSTISALQPVPVPQTAAAAGPRASGTETVVLGTAATCCQDLLLQILRTSSFRRTGCTCSTTSSAACSANSTPFGTLRGCKRPCLTGSTTEVLGAVTESCEQAEALLALSRPTVGAAAASGSLDDTEVAREQRQQQQQQKQQQKQPSLEQQVALTLLGCADTATALAAGSTPAASAPAPAENGDAGADAEADTADLTEVQVGSEPQSATASAVWAVDGEASAGARSLEGWSEVLGDDDEQTAAVATAAAAAAEAAATAATAGAAGGTQEALPRAIPGWTRAMYDELLAPSTCGDSSSNSRSPSTANTNTTMSDPFATDAGTDSPGFSQSVDHSVLWAVVLKGYNTYSNPLAEPDDLCDWPVRQPCISRSSFGRSCGSSSSSGSGSSSGLAHAEVGHLLDLEEVEKEVAITALNKQLRVLTGRITQQMAHDSETQSTGACMHSTGGSSSRSTSGGGSAATSNNSSSGGQQELLAEVLPLLREVNAVLQHCRH